MNRYNQTPSYGSMASTSEVQIIAAGGNAINAEITDVCGAISNNIFAISQSWKTLESSGKQLGTKKDGDQLRNRIHETQLSTNDIITETNGKFRQLTLIVRKGDKKQKLQVEKLTESYKEVIARYSTTQKQVAEKLKLNLLVKADIEYDLEASQEQNGESIQQQQQVINELAHNNELFLDRELRVRKIEADLIDVNAIMKELGVLIHEQGGTIDTIENSIDYAVGHVEEGNAELVKAQRYQNKYRRRLLYLVIFAIIIAAILVTVLVVQLKN